LSLGQEERGPQVSSGEASAPQVGPGQVGSAAELSARLREADAAAAPLFIRPASVCIAPVY